MQHFLFARKARKRESSLWVFEREALHCCCQSDIRSWALSCAVNTSPTSCVTLFRILQRLSIINVDESYIFCKKICIHYATIILGQSWKWYKKYETCIFCDCHYVTFGDLISEYWKDRQCDRSRNCVTIKGEEKHKVQPWAFQRSLPPRQVPHSNSQQQKMEVGWWNWLSSSFSTFHKLLHCGTTGNTRWKHSTDQE